MTSAPAGDGEFLDRDFSALAFQRRVLSLARDAGIPLLERLGFVAICAANLDEFLMTRVGRLSTDRSCDSRVRGRLTELSNEVHAILGEARNCFEGVLRPALAERGVRILDYSELTPTERAHADRAYRERWLAAIAPPDFEQPDVPAVIRNIDIHLAIRCRRAAGDQLLIVPVPDALGSFVPIDRPLRPADGWPSSRFTFVWLDQVMAAHLRAAAVGQHIESIRPFRVLRHASLVQHEPDGSDIGYAMRVADAARLRHVNPVITLSVDDACDDDTLRALQAHPELASAHVHRGGARLGLRRLAELANLEHPSLRYPARHPAAGPSDLFAAIRTQDQLLHHPFDSFEPVARLIETAATDESVLDMAVTLYRTGFRSRIAEALVAAAAAGRRVHVVLEMHARFDEEANAYWATRLRGAGAEVTFGSPDRKVHAKLAVITRDERHALRRYVHVSSGNYHEGTSQQYTDFALLTCAEDLAEDALRVFDFIRAGSDEPAPAFSRLLVAPLTLRQEFVRRVRREMAHARSRAARIVLKMNTLTDPEAIRLLYQASQAGVDIELFVRGICRLRPGVTGRSERIRVWSHVGRFLEHGRAWYFHNGGRPEMFIGSADLRTRSLDSRVEVMAPLPVPLAERCLNDILDDTAGDRRTWTLQPSGRYIPAASGLAATHDTCLPRSGAMA